MTIASGPAFSSSVRSRLLRRGLAVLAIQLASGLPSAFGSPSVLAAAAVAATVPGGTVNETPPCTPSGELEPICGLQAPEDLAPLPGGGRLLVVQMHGPTHLPDSNIAELDLTTRQ